jgi:hypothetical protein
MMSEPASACPRKLESSNFKVPTPMHGDIENHRNMFKQFQIHFFQNSILMFKAGHLPAPGVFLHFPGSTEQTRGAAEMVLEKNTVEATRMGDLSATSAG